uniref:Uncharacterized protein n=1 Tax=Romanomermis culicivorax TaxID=13658 RepID=A0A915IQ90_ROMCU
MNGVTVEKFVKYNLTTVGLKILETNENPTDIVLIMTGSQYSTASTPDQCFFLPEANENFFLANEIEIFTDSLFVYF